MPRRPGRKGRSGTQDANSTTASGSASDPPRNEEARERLVTQLRMALEPHVTDRDLLQAYLVVNSWNLDVALQNYRQDLTAFLLSQAASQLPEELSPAIRQLLDTADTTDASPSNTIHNESPRGMMRRLNLPHNNIIEHERRIAATRFIDRLNEGRDEESAVHLSATEAILLLHLANWDIAVAVREFISPENARERLHVEFDPMRTRESAAIAARNGQRQEHQDERLALLIAITQRSDWYSLLQHLQIHHWNLILALTEWFYTGIPPVDHPERHKARNKGKHLGRRLNWDLTPMDMPAEESTKANATADQRRFKAEAPEYMKDEDYQGEPKPTPDRSTTNRGNRANEFLVDDDRSPIQPGLPLRHKLLIEYITKGRYRTNRLKHRDYLWPELGDEEGDGDNAEQVPEDPSVDLLNDLLEADDSSLPAPEHSKASAASTSAKGKRKSTAPGAPPKFDWNNPDHVKALNNLRRQQAERITGTVVRPRMQSWSRREVSHLFWLNFEEVMRRIYDNPGKTVGDFSPLSMPESRKQDMARRLNDFFMDPKKAKGDFRGERNSPAVQTQIGRHSFLSANFRTPLRPGSRWPIWLDVKSATAESDPSKRAQRPHKPISSGEDDNIHVPADAQIHPDLLRAVREAASEEERGDEEMGEEERAAEIAKAKEGKKRAREEDGEDEEGAAGAA